MFILGLVQGIFFLFDLFFGIAFLRCSLLLFYRMFFIVGQRTRCRRDVVVVSCWVATGAVVQAQLWLLQAQLLRPIFAQRFVRLRDVRPYLYTGSRAGYPVKCARSRPAHQIHQQSVVCFAYHVTRRGRTRFSSHNHRLRAGNILCECTLRRRHGRGRLRAHLCRPVHIPTASKATPILVMSIFI